MLLSLPPVVESYGYIHVVYISLFLFIFQNFSICNDPKQLSLPTIIVVAAEALS